MRRLPRLHRRRAAAGVLAALRLQVEACLDGVVTARTAVATGAGDGGAPARQAMEDVEHVGDGHRAAFVSALARTLVTPLDREDLFRLSRSIDDVLDNLRDFVREWDLYDRPRVAALVPILDTIEEAVRLLAAAVDAVGHRDAAGGETQAVRKAANAIRYRYQEAMAELLVDPIDAQVLRTRELLRRLDIVGIRLDEVADVLADATVKRTLV